MIGILGNEELIDTGEGNGCDVGTKGDLTFGSWMIKGMTVKGKAGHGL